LWPRPLTAGADYRFITTWRVSGSVDEVKAVPGDAEALPRWRPSVYLDATIVEEGAADRVGRTVSLHTQGWLPYTLRWELRITEPITDDGFALRATGDLTGTGRWTFERDGDEVVIIHDWRVAATKPLLRRLSWLLRPLFSANHRWAMSRGEESLRMELRRRRGEAGDARGRILNPPPPSFPRLRRALPSTRR
jgi:hypothetical protein